MNAVGMNTPINTNAMAMSAPDTSSIVSCAAWRGDRCFSSINREMFSTTTMASSTTMPIASTSPNNDKLFSEKPNAASTAPVPTNEIGIAMIGTNAARQLCKNTSTTSATSTTASNNVCSTAEMDFSMYSVGLYGMRYAMPGGNDFAASANDSFTASAVVSAFEPGSCEMAMATVGLPDK